MKYLAILVYLGSALWGKVLNGTVIVLELFVKYMGFVLGAIVLVAIAGAIYFSIKRNNFELDLLAGGTCVPVMEQLYTPPPTQTCGGRNSDGGCISWQTHYHTPYMRTRVRCDGHKDFWRRTSSIPLGSFK